MTTANADFRKRLRARRVVAGTFIKTPAYPLVEIAGRAGLDFGLLRWCVSPIIGPKRCCVCLIWAQPVSWCRM